MSPVATPELSDTEVDRFVASALDEVSTPVEALPSPERRRRLREILRPKANGDQDAW